MAAGIPCPPVQPISLNFHLSCLQNRRARIYLDGITLDQFPETLDVSAFAKHIVLSGKNLIPLPLDDVNARPSLFFHHGTCQWSQIPGALMPSRHKFYRISVWRLYRPVWNSCSSRAFLGPFGRASVAALSVILACPSVRNVVPSHSGLLKCPQSCSNSGLVAASRKTFPA